MGQEDVQALPGGAKGLAEAERKLVERMTIGLKRGKLEQQALRLAKQDLNSKLQKRWLALRERLDNDRV